MKRIMAAIDAGKLKVDRADNGAWTELTGADRIKIYGKCGEECFMKPSADKEEILKNPKENLKFPICRVPRSTKSCAVSASGLLAANRRARLTKVHPDVVEETRLLMEKLGTTAVARKQMPVKSVRVVNIMVDDKSMFKVTITYEDGVREVLAKPLSGKVVMKRFGNLISSKQRARLME